MRQAFAKKLHAEALEAKLAEQVVQKDPHAKFCPVDAWTKSPPDAGEALKHAYPTTRKRPTLRSSSPH